MKPELKITKFGIVDDIKNDPNYSFVSDSQEVDNIKHYLGLDDMFEDLDSYNSFFIIVKNGEYETILGMTGDIPYLTKTLDKIELILS